MDSATKKKCGVNAKDCLSNDDSFGADGNGRHAVFNALDTLLKDSLERLKMMRLVSIYIKFEEFSLNFEVICSFNLVTIVTFIYDMGIRRINIELLTVRYYYYE